MNEVGGGLMIQDVLEGVPVDVSAEVIMELVSDYYYHFHFGSWRPEGCRVDTSG